MNLKEHKRVWGDAIPPEGQRFEGVYPKTNRHGEVVSWYTSIYDGKRAGKPNPDKPGETLKARYILTRDTYWECCFAREAELEKNKGGDAQELTPRPTMVVRASAKAQSELTVAELFTQREHNDATLSSYARSAGRTLSKELVMPAEPGKLAQSYPVSAISIKWAEERVKEWKSRLVTEETIFKKLKLLAATVDWHIERVTRDRIDLVGEQQALREKPINPLKHLPNGIHQYLVKELPEGMKAPKVQSRKRRLFPGEEDAIMAVLTGNFYLLKKPTMPSGRLFYHPKDALWRPSLLVMFQLNMNTAMRLRECYTLQLWQLQFKGKNSQILLPADKTKTDAPRSFPMTPEVQAMLLAWVKTVGAKNPSDPIFPMWWKGETDEKKLKNISSELSKQFRKVFDVVHALQPDAEPLKEHDLRHEGTYRWVMKRDPLTGHYAYARPQCKEFTGHKTDSMFDRYFNERGSDAAAVLYGGSANDEQDWGAMLAA